MYRAKAWTNFLITTGLKLIEQLSEGSKQARCKFLSNVKMMTKGKQFSSDKDLLRNWDNERAKILKKMTQNW